MPLAGWAEIQAHEWAEPEYAQLNIYENLPLVNIYVTFDIKLHPLNTYPIDLK